MLSSILINNETLRLHQQLSTLCKHKMDTIEGVNEKFIATYKKSLHRLSNSDSKKQVLAEHHSYSDEYDLSYGNFYLELDIFKGITHYELIPVLFFDAFVKLCLL